MKNVMKLVGISIAMLVIICGIILYSSTSKIKLNEISKDKFLDITRASMSDIEKGVGRRGFKYNIDGLKYYSFQYEKTVVVTLSGEKYQLRTQSEGYCVKYKNIPIRLYNLHTAYTGRDHNLKIVEFPDIGYSLGKSRNYLVQTLMVEKKTNKTIEREKNNVLIEIEF